MSSARIPDIEPFIANDQSAVRYYLGFAFFIVAVGLAIITIAFLPAFRTDNVIQDLAQKVGGGFLARSAPARNGRKPSPASEISRSRSIKRGRRNMPPGGVPSSPNARQPMRQARVVFPAPPGPVINSETEGLQNTVSSKADHG